MTALRTVLAFNGPAIPMTTRHARIARPHKALVLLRNMALFLASPFIGLAYAVLLPFVGFGMLLWVATAGWRKPRAAAAVAAEEAAPEAPAQAPAIAEAAAEEARTEGLGGVAKLALKIVAAPFAGLVFVVLAPLAALGALAWFAVKAACATTA